MPWVFKAVRNSSSSTSWIIPMMTPLGVSFAIVIACLELCAVTMMKFDRFCTRATLPPAILLISLATASPLSFATLCLLTTGLMVTVRHQAPEWRPPLKVPESPMIQAPADHRATLTPPSVPRSGGGARARKQREAKERGQFTRLNNLCYIIFHFITKHNNIVGHSTVPCFVLFICVNV